MILYRMTLVLLAPVLAILFGYRWITGKESRGGLAERFGRCRAAPDAAKIIWVHGASLGELTAARPLLEAILSRDPALEIVVTMNSRTARDMVRAWGNARLHGRTAPLDYPHIVRRFCAIWSPRALVVLENELWPTRLSLCRASGVPVLIAGGRMSDRAQSMWGRFPSLAKAVMSAVTYLAPLDRQAAERFRALGLDPARIGAPLLLKSTVALPAPDPAHLAALRRRFDPARTVLAASTHEGEDAVILGAFAKARHKQPDLRLILAPRHPDRAAAIARLIKNQSLSCHRRSSAGPVADDAVVLLGDTLGEMALWYSLAGITLIGGTWVDKGGHTPFEPAQFGSAIIHGPSVHNHAQAFSALDTAGGAVLAGDEVAISEAILMLGDEVRRAEVVKMATQALVPMRENSASVEAFVDRLMALTAP